MMIIKTILRSAFRLLKGIENWAEEEKPKLAKVPSGGEPPNAIPWPAPLVQAQSVWDYLAPKENTQANHLIAAVGYEEWVEMLEIKRRIKEVFGMDYKNERSLYPYVKTMSDCGLFEFSDIGGKRKWKKKALLLKIKVLEKEPQEETEKEAEKSGFF